MKKTFDIVRTILVWIVVLVAVAMTVFTFFSLTTLNRYDRAVFGYKIFIVNSDSMKTTDFKAGDLIFVKDIDPKALQAGDIITFISKDENSLDETLTHKIRSVAVDSYGNPGFITYGTSTGATDESIVLYKDIIGKYEFCIPGLGKVLNFLKTTEGFFLCIFTPIMLVIIYEIINFFVLLRKSKREETERLEAERLRSEKLMEELLVLKAQLEEKMLALQCNAASNPVHTTAPSKKRVKVKVIKSYKNFFKASKTVPKRKKRQKYSCKR